MLLEDDCDKGCLTHKQRNGAVMKRAKTPVVHVVDDDPDVCRMMNLLLGSVGLSVEIYGSAEEFLADESRLGHGPECLVVDLCLPGMNGIELQRRLRRNGVDAPVIMISAFGDVPTAVQSMAEGAFDFLEKPFRRAALLQRIRAALQANATQLAEQQERSVLAARRATLTDRERETLELMVAGQSTGEIAFQFGIGVKTVAKHQSRVLEKMGAKNAVELVYLMQDFGKPRHDSARQPQLG